ncbi:MAG: hypothetical protein IPL47_01705 [Phyllobacteriaceae bacterium]|nr:hypothetical protein [Phyllobacteriaceae bacterium]
MGLRNRVDPFGDIHSVAARGTLTGNRGAIHDPATQTLNRRWTTKAWICCALDWKGKNRDPMGVNTESGGPGWTALFFLDEATALAAGHRPCFACRREAATRYFACLDAEFGHRPKAAEVDARLHSERLAAGAKPKPLSPIDLPGLPDGTMVASGGRPFLLRERRALPWSFLGYGAPVALSDLMRSAVTLVTPVTSVKALRSGYKLAAG